MSIGIFGGPPNVIACIPRQGQVVFLNSKRQRVHWCVVQYCAQNLSGHFVLNAKTIGWGRFRPAGKIPHFNLFWWGGRYIVLFYVGHTVDQRRRVMWWNWEVIFYTLFVFICQDNDLSSVIVNPLRAKFFRENIKHIFTFYVITPHWYDTDP